METFRFGLSFSCKLTLRFICLRFFDSYRILKERGVASRLVIPCSTLCRPVVDCLHNLNEAGDSYQESHRKEMSEFNSLIQVVSCTKVLRWSFLERINYFSFDLCSEFGGLFLVLSG